MCRILMVKASNRRCKGLLFEGAVFKALDCMSKAPDFMSKVLDFQPKVHFEVSD